MHSLKDLAARGATVSGECAPELFERLQFDEIELLAPLRWQASAGFMPRQERPAYAGQPVLHFTAQAQLRAPCARCGETVSLAVNLDKRYVVFDTEAAADHAPLDDDDYDALVHETPFNWLALAEDELFLALDPPPRHDTCSAEPAVAASAKIYPFAHLLKPKSE